MTLTRHSKEYDDSVNSEWLTKRYNYDTGTTVTVGSGTKLTHQDFGMCVGYNTSNFTQLLKQGLIIPATPWRQEFCKGDAGGELNMVYWASGTKYLKYSVGPYPTFTSDAVWIPSASTHLPQPSDVYVQEAAAAIYNEGFDVLTFIAEFLDIKRTFIDTGKRLVGILKVSKWPQFWRQFARQYKNDVLGFKKALALFRPLANDWLNARYGWRTMFYDINNIVDAFTGFDEKRTRYSERKGTTSTSTNSTLEPGPSSSYASTELSTIETITTGVSGHVIADIDIPRFRVNPFQTAWELIPLSFVVDWFVSVGNSISAASFLLNASNYTSSIGVKSSVKRETYQYVVSLGPDTEQCTWESTGSCVDELVVRTPRHVPIKPQLTFKVNAAKVTDLVSLILQRIRR